MSSTPFRRPSLVSIEQSPLQRALENYNEMERDLADCIEKNRQLAVDNGSLIAEVNMLRESLERADGDRIRLQAGLGDAKSAYQILLRLRDAGCFPAFKDPYDKKGAA